MTSLSELKAQARARFVKKLSAMEMSIVGPFLDSVIKETAHAVKDAVMPEIMLSTSDSCPLCDTDRCYAAGAYNKCRITVSDNFTRFLQG